MSDNVPHSQLDSKNLHCTYSQTCSSLEPAYLALYTEFLTKSRHNDIPNSPVARARLRTLIDQTRSDSQTCSESTTHSQILRVLELQESLLAPIRTLPEDVLIAIFEQVIETSGEPGITFTSRIYTRLSGCILSLAWICFWWRYEAVSYPTFWSRIKIDFHHQDDFLRTTEMTAFLAELILRSGVSASLSTEIVLSNPDAPLPPVVTMLVAQAHRWRQATIKLSFVSSRHIDSLFPLEPSSTRFPLLVDLTVNSRCSFSNWILDCHPPLQKLELVKLSESYADVLGSRSLKTLKIRCYTGVSLARLLHVCPCLETLALESFDFVANPDVQQITCRSSLLTLDLGRDIDNIPVVENGAWNCVTLPKLIKLEVALPSLVNDEQWPDGFYEPDTSLRELKEVLKRSECALQHVNLMLCVEQLSLPREMVLEMVEKFFEDMPVKAQGSFIEDVLLGEWNVDNYHWVW
ncbi:hypothetical protein BDP27DRAFT_1429504 [Rhodocollybia butyracea]|uniref:F-box domain-containing protein n=1 Tax=Rhodocollybia butyracea TaxID=206335 RepID=A0A9P5PEY5_9AGAR|nr:hypothetical protein BDP27DRAFT_1429504 [Rhodocollybia butyracea]